MAAQTGLVELALIAFVVSLLPAPAFVKAAAVASAVALL